MDKLDQLYTLINLKDAKLLLKICGNILDYPRNSKFRDLSYGRISRKFIAARPAVDLLFSVGFKHMKRQGKENRLQLHGNDLSKLKRLQVLLTIQQLGSESSEAKPFNKPTEVIRFRQTMISPNKLNTNDDKEMIVSQLKQMGFGSNSIEDAFISCQSNNIDKLIDFILHSNKPCLLIKQCTYFVSLQQLLKQNQADTEHATILLDDFLHLLEHHDNDFEFIFNQLGGFCDIKSCDHFKSDIEETEELQDIIFCQIKNKIHYHFRHSFDNGLRLKQMPNDQNIKQIIQMLLINHKNTNHNHRMSRYNQFHADGLNDNCFKTATHTEVDSQYSYHPVEIDVYDEEKALQFIQQHIEYAEYDYNDTYNVDEFGHAEQLYEQITGLKQPLLCPPDDKEYFMSEKFHEDIEEQYGKKLDTNDEKTYIDDKIYSFGCPFRYGYDEKFGYELTTPAQWIQANPKFDNLKHELTENPIARLYIAQYNSEYYKAVIHFNSRHRKKYYKEMPLECVLSVMIYCNFDVLQNKFSETYRKNMSDHDNFYNLGKWLKIAVHHHGKMDVYTSNHKIFYHGVDRKMWMPSIDTQIQNKRFNWVDERDGVLIYGPLSTTTSLTVAANFTNLNKGLIFEFEIVFDKSITHKKWTCFSASWLSDYPNEFEYIFIQNIRSLRITNIMNPSNGFEYDIILNALRKVDTIFSLKHTNHESCELIQRMLANQLPYESKQYKKFDSLDSYCREIIKRYEMNKCQIKIDCQIISSLECPVFGLFYSTSEWIKLNVLVSLFKYLKRIEIEDACVSRNTFEILLKQFNSKKASLRFQSKIWIKIKKYTEDISQYTEEYKQRFAESGAGYTIEQDECCLLLYNN